MYRSDRRVTLEIFIAPAYLIAIMICKFNQIIHHIKKKNSSNWLLAKNRACTIVIHGAAALQSSLNSWASADVGDAHQFRWLGVVFFCFFFIVKSSLFDKTCIKGIKLSAYVTKLVTKENACTWSKLALLSCSIWIRNEHRGEGRRERRQEEREAFLFYLLQLVIAISN